MTAEADWEIELPPDPSDVSKRWDAQYRCRNGQPLSARHLAVSDALRSLENPTPEQVEAVIGHDGWTRLQCDGGHDRPDRVVVIDINGGEFAVHLCRQCALEIAERLK